MKLNRSGNVIMQYILEDIFSPFRDQEWYLNPGQHYSLTQAAIWHVYPI